MRIKTCSQYFMASTCVRFFLLLSSYFIDCLVLFASSTPHSYHYKKTTEFQPKKLSEILWKWPIQTNFLQKVFVGTIWSVKKSVGKSSEILRNYQQTYYWRITDERYQRYISSVTRRHVITNHRRHICW